jgi:hypothetical protein
MKVVNERRHFMPGLTPKELPPLVLKSDLVPQDPEQARERLEAAEAKRQRRANKRKENEG